MPNKREKSPKVPKPHVSSRSCQSFRLFTTAKKFEFFTRDVKKKRSREKETREERRGEDHEKCPKISTYEKIFSHRLYTFVPFLHIILYVLSLSYDLVSFLNFPSFLLLLSVHICISMGICIDACIKG